MNYINSMALSQLQLEAFREISRLGSFTKAADFLGLTQSALSHRIRILEEELETTVFIRAGSNVRLTESGARLLRFCQVQMLSEAELIGDLQGNSKKEMGLNGRLRVGGYSSVMRPLVLPGISAFLRENPFVKLELLIRELSELPNLLISGQVDLLLSATKINVAGLIESFLGFEKNVLIQAVSQKDVPDIFLDHDSEDQTTYDFLKSQGKKEVSIQRSFLDNIDGILDAAKLGLGKAVVPLHMISTDKEVKIVGHHKPLLTPVYLYQFKQPYFTKLHMRAAEIIQVEVSKRLRQKA